MSEKIDLSQGYKIRDQEATYFLTLQVVHWVDIFSRQVYRDIIIDNLKYCQENKGLLLHAYVIMTNHIHMIVSSKEGNLSDTIRDFKSYTSKKIIEAIKSEPESRREWMLHIFEEKAKTNKRSANYQFWTHENHPVGLDTNMLIDQKLDYIHNNPVNAGLVFKQEDYVYSSATNYSGLGGSLINVELLH